MLQGKCPRCREGNIFTYPVSRISSLIKMNDTCPELWCAIGARARFLSGCHVCWLWIYCGYAGNYRNYSLRSGRPFRMGIHWCHYRRNGLVSTAELPVFPNRLSLFFGGIKYNHRCHNQSNLLTLSIITCCSTFEIKVFNTIRRVACYFW